jgi:hypothetical protein
VREHRVDGRLAVAHLEEGDGVLDGDLGTWKSLLRMLNSS